MVFKFLLAFVLGRVLFWLKVFKHLKRDKMGLRATFWGRKGISK